MSEQIDGKKLLVFLSHASEDKEVVRDLCKRLKADGFDPRLDEERIIPGMDWNHEIKIAMRDSDSILLCFSKLSVEKEGYIQREYKKAMDYQDEMPEGAIFVIPVRLDDCEIPYSIQELQFVDFPDGYERLRMSLNMRAERLKRTVKPSKQNQPAAAVKSPARSGGFSQGSSVSAGDFQNIQGTIIIANNVNIHGNAQSTNQTIHNHQQSEFLDELKCLQEQIATLKSQSQLEPAVARRVDLVSADVEDALAEAAKPKPSAERIKNTLDSAKETMEKLGGSIGSALTLGTTLGNLAMMAIKLFGG